MLEKRNDDDGVARSRLGRSVSSSNPMAPARRDAGQDLSGSIGGLAAVAKPGDQGIGRDLADGRRRLSGVRVSHGDP